MSYFSCQRHPDIYEITCKKLKRECDMKEFFRNFYNHPKMLRRLILCFISVCIMRLRVSWLDRLAWGTDPCSTTTLAISAKLGMSLGTFQALFNLILFIIVFWRDKKQIGFGTIFNMFLVGYAYNFMSFLMDELEIDYHFPLINFGENFVLSDLLWNLLFCVILLSVFVFFASIYMSVDLGTAPYDALSVIIANSQKKLSFRIIRILWDIAFTILGFAFGGTVGIVTIIMALTIGPMVTFVGKHIRKYLI